MRYISSSYKLYTHYLTNFNIDIKDRFQTLLSQKEGELDAFMALMKELREKDDFGLLNESTLQVVLVGLGFPVRYISSHYKLYTHWLKKGYNIGDLFNQKYYSENKRISIRQVIQEISELPLGLPEGNFKQSLSAYLWYVLVYLGKLQKKDRMSKVSHEPNREAVPPKQDKSDTQIDLMKLLRSSRITQEEYELATLILHSWTQEEIDEELCRTLEEVKKHTAAVFSKLRTLVAFDKQKSPSSGARLAQ